jgi:hypothetical protein
VTIHSHAAETRRLRPGVNQRIVSQISAAAPATIRYQAKGAKPWREM